MFVEIKNFISGEFCDEISNAGNSLINKDSLEYEFNRQGNSVRSTDHKSLKSIQEKLRTRLNEVIEKKLMYEFTLDLNRLKDSGFTFHRYGKKDNLNIHSDGITNEVPGHPRVLSIVIHLTNNPNADLIFPRHNKHIKTEKGKLIAFLPHSCYEHYCNNNSGSNREIVVTWLLDHRLVLEKV
tara:strand:+ start:1548 stop:2093 length:546 start_codon:yes stop_codon:yes gene_type:complete